MTHRLQSVSVRLIHREIREDGEIVAVLESIQVRPQIPFERSVAAKRFQGVSVPGVREQADAGFLVDGEIGWQRSLALERRRQRARRDFARLDIGLVERVDADDGAGDRDGHFPAEELLTDVVDVGDVNPHYRVRGVFQGIHGGVLRLTPEVGRDRGRPPGSLASSC
jgi:hypothetical protein